MTLKVTSPKVSAPEKTHMGKYKKLNTTHMG
jgi:hypothetical protein